MAKEVQTNEEGSPVGVIILRNEHTNPSSNELFIFEEKAERDAFVAGANELGSNLDYYVCIHLPSALGMSFVDFEDTFRGINPITVDRIWAEGLANRRGDKAVPLFKDLASMLHAIVATGRQEVADLFVKEITETHPNFSLCQEMAAVISSQLRRLRNADTLLNAHENLMENLLDESENHRALLEGLTENRRSFLHAQDLGDASGADVLDTIRNRAKVG